ncbi:MAG: alpha/beta hydrolase, partial [Bacteroidota bacterium]
AMISLEEQSACLIEAVDKVADGQLILVGHSLGGPVAARMMMDYPSKVVGAVLVAPSIDPELEKRAWYRYLGKLRLVKYLIPTSLWVTNEEIYDLRRELMAMQTGWERIKGPVIVIQGTEDNLVPKENAYYARKMLPDSLVSVNMLDGVNHFIPWSHPQTISEALLQLARLENP